ncbi:MAG: replicative DNA helicase [Alphaproteobacteria bacterium GM7ARS4]|nr:replicative DNA helicase [Alphaproteobacteria bacterium GM7ARS4]
MDKTSAKILETASVGGEQFTWPHNYDIERALLGTLLVNNAAYERVGDDLRGFHFADGETGLHGSVYDVLARLIGEEQRAVDVTLLQHHLPMERLFADGRGDAYLVDLVESAVLTANVSHYGDVILDLYQRRVLIALAQDMASDAQASILERPAPSIAEDAEQRLYTLSEVEEKRLFQPFSSVLARALKDTKDAYRHKDGVSGLATGFVGVDKMLGGLQKSDLIVVAGRPSMGKSALAMNIAWAIASGDATKGKEHYPVAFFSLEMSSDQMALRVLSEKSGVPASAMRNGLIDEEKYLSIREAAQYIDNVPLYIDDTPGLSVAVLRRRARRLKRLKGLALIVVDYMQLVQGSSKRQHENRVQEISEVSRDLKALAKELDVPVIAVSQLSRKVEGRDDKIPQLSDLRESGSIEQDADVVIFIYREAYYERRNEPKAGTPEHSDWQKKMENIHNMARLIVAKQRNGSVGNIDMVFDESTTRFYNLYRE